MAPRAPCDSEDNLTLFNSWWSSHALPFCVGFLQVHRLPSTSKSICQVKRSLYTVRRCECEYRPVCPSLPIRAYLILSHMQWLTPAELSLKIKCNVSNQMMNQQTCVPLMSSETLKRCTPHFSLTVSPSAGTAELPSSSKEDLDHRLFPSLQKNGVFLHSCQTSAAATQPCKSQVIPERTMSMWHEGRREWSNLWDKFNRAVRMTTLKNAGGKKPGNVCLDVVAMEMSSVNINEPSASTETRRTRPIVGAQTWILSCSIPGRHTHTQDSLSLS